MKREYCKLRTAGAVRKLLGLLNIDILSKCFTIAPIYLQ